MTRLSRAASITASACSALGAEQGFCSPNRDELNWYAFYERR